MRLPATVACAALVLAALGQPASAAKMSMTPDAREMAPAALLGIWKVDTAASSKSANPDAVQLRSFQYTKDGKLLVNFFTIAKDGAQQIGNWELQLDGMTAGYEFRSDNGSTPIAVIHFKKVDEHTLTLTNSVAGVEESTALYKLSEDGKTLTMTRSLKNAQVVYVYHKWDGH